MWKKPKNLKCDKTQKHQMWQNSNSRFKKNIKKCAKTAKNVKKLKHLKCDKTQKLKMWHNLKTQNMTKLKNTKGDKSKTKCVMKLKISNKWQN